MKLILNLFLVMFVSFIFLGCEKKSGNSDVEALSIHKAVSLSNVSVNSSIVLEVSKALNTSTVTTSNVYIKNSSGNAISSQVKYESLKIKITPTQILSPSSTYTLVVTTSVKSTDGGSLSKSYTWDFKTATTSDTTAPTLKTTLPTASSTADVSTNVIFEFNELIDTASLSNAIAVKDSSYNTVAGTFKASERWIWFTPTNNLNINQTYTVTIPAAVTIKDLANNAYAGSRSFSFTTSATALQSGGFSKVSSDLNLQKSSYSLYVLDDTSLVVGSENYLYKVSTARTSNVPVFQTTATKNDTNFEKIYDIKGLSSTRATACNMTYNYLVLATSKGVSIVDKSNLSVKSNTTLSSPAYGVDVNCENGSLYAYVANANGGISVLNITNPLNVTTTKTITVSDRTVFDVKVNNSKIYAAMYEGGINVYDISGSTPQQTITTSSTTRSLEIDGSTLVVADGVSGIRKYSIDGTNGDLTLQNQTASLTTVIDTFSTTNNIFAITTTKGISVYSKNNLSEIAYQISSTNRFIDAAADSEFLYTISTSGVLSAYNQTSTAVNGSGLDGYLKGATVFKDCNTNRVFDNGTDVNTTTDDNGSFSFTNVPYACKNAKLILTGGVDSDTGIAFKGMLTADAGAKNITPLTTLAQSDSSLVSSLLSQLGLTSIDDDFMASPKNPKAMRLASSIANVLTLVADTTGTTLNQDIMNTTMSKIALKLKDANLTNATAMADELSQAALDALDVIATTYTNVKIDTNKRSTFKNAIATMVQSINTAITDNGVVDGNAIATQQSSTKNTMQDSMAKVFLKLNIKNIDLSDNNITSIQYIGTTETNGTYETSVVAGSTTLTNGDALLSVPVYKPDGNYTLKVNLDNNSTSYWYDFVYKNLKTQKYNNTDFVSVVNNDSNVTVDMNSIRDHESTYTSDLIISGSMTLSSNILVHDANVTLQSGATLNLGNYNLTIDTGTMTQEGTVNKESGMIIGSVANAVSPLAPTLKLRSTFNYNNLLGIYDTNGTIEDMAISSDGTKAYIANGSKGVVALNLTTTTPSVLWTYFDESSIKAIVLSPDGEKVYVTNNTGLLVLDTAQNPAENRLLGSYNQLQSSPTSIALSVDGTKAYVGTSSMLYRFDIIDNLNITETFTQYDYTNINDIKVTDSKIYLATDNGLIIVEDIGNDGFYGINGYEPDYNVKAIAVSNDELTIYLAEGNGGVEVYDLEYGPVGYYKNTEDSADDIQLSSDGTKLYVANSDNILLLDVNITAQGSMSLLSSIDTLRCADKLVLAPDDSRLYTGCSDYNTLNVIDTKYTTPSHIDSLQTDVESSNTAFAMIKDTGKIFITNYSLGLITISSSNGVFGQSNTNSTYLSAIDTLLSKDETKLYIAIKGDRDTPIQGSIKVINSTSMELINEFEVSSNVNKMVISPDGAKLCVIAYDDNLTVSSLEENGSMIQLATSAELTSINDLEFSQDGTKIYVCNGYGGQGEVSGLGVFDNELQLTSESVFINDEPMGNCDKLIVSSDGLKIYTTGTESQEIQVFNTQSTPEHLGVYYAHGSVTNIISSKISDIAYITTDNGVEIVDTSNDIPVFQGFYKANDARDVVLAENENKIYVLTGSRIVSLNITPQIYLEKNFTSHDLNVSLADVNEDALTLSVDVNNTNITTTDFNPSNLYTFAQYDGMNIPIQLTSVLNATGVVQMDVNVSDSIHDIGKSVYLKVYDKTYAPSVDAPASVSLNGQTQTMSFDINVSDVDTDSNSLTINAIVSDFNLFPSGVSVSNVESGAATISANMNPEYFPEGAVYLNITVSDGIYNTTKIVPINITIGQLP